MTYRKLLRFCERIERSGKKEQQYVAEGIRTLMQLRGNEFITDDGLEKMQQAREKIAAAIEENKTEDERGFFPEHFPENGVIVEYSDGSVWVVREMFWRAELKKKAPCDDEVSFSARNIKLDFGAEDILSGAVKIRGEEHDYGELASI